MPFRLPRKSHTGHWLAAAAVCLTLPTTFATDLELAQAHQLFLVDHSGSMHQKYDWIGDAAQALQNNSKAASAFGLASFSNDFRPLALDGEQFGNLDALNQALGALGSGGGKEDGHMAMKQAVSNYALSEQVAPHLILITDEHRSVVDSRIDATAVAELLHQVELPLTVIVHVRFNCEDGRMALGMNSQGQGVIMERSGNLTTCAIGELNEAIPSGHSIADYLDLALSTGGSAWDIRVPRAGTLGAATFARAFAEVHGATVTQQLSQEPVLPRVSFSPDRPKVGDVVTFNASAQYSADNPMRVTGWSWDFDADAIDETHGAAVAHRFTSAGTFDVTLTLQSDQGVAPIQHTFRVVVEK